MAIRCACCGKKICISDPVSLFKPPGKSGYISPSYAMQHEGSYIKCMRHTCVDTNAEIRGFWVVGEDGKGTVREYNMLRQLIDSGASAVFIAGEEHYYSE